MAARNQRLGANEALFREVNERVAEVAEHFFEAGDDVSPLQFVCECAYPDCAEQISMTLVEYEAVRAVPTRFFVTPGHELPEIERVVERHPAYLVVDKDEPEAEEVAIETDPRA